MESMSTPKRSTRKALTLEERVGVISKHNKGESCTSISKSLQVGKTQIQSIVKDKESILKRYHDGEDSESKNIKRQKTNYHVLNETIWDLS